MNPGRALNPAASIVSTPVSIILRAIRLIRPSWMKIEPLAKPFPFQMSASLTRIFRSSRSTAGSDLFFDRAKFLCAILTQENSILLHQRFRPSLTLVTISLQTGRAGSWDPSQPSLTLLRGEIDYCGSDFYNDFHRQ